MVDRFSQFDLTESGALEHALDGFGAGRDCGAHAYLSDDGWNDRRSPSLERAADDVRAWFGQDEAERRRALHQR